MTPSTLQVFAPVYAYLTLRRHHDQILAEEPNTMLRFGFLINAFEREYYYWEIVVTARKVLLARPHPNVNRVRVRVRVRLRRSCLRAPTLMRI